MYKYKTGTLSRQRRQTSICVWYNKEGGADYSVYGPGVLRKSTSLNSSGFCFSLCLTGLLLLLLAVLYHQECGVL